MKHSLRIVVAAATLAVLAVLAVPVTTPAGAVQTAEVVISKDGPVRATFGPIPANGAGASTAPNGCGYPGGTNRFERTCDNVPIRIVDPQLGPTEDYLVTITLTWIPSEEVDEEAGVNDLDMYLYDNRQLRARKDPTCKDQFVGADGASCFTRVGTSGNLVQPEEIKLFSPEPLVNYNLVVVNYYGPNVSYTIEADLKVEGFDAPFEDLGPTFSGRTRPPSSDGQSSFAAPVDLSGDDGPTGGPDPSSFAGVAETLSGGRTLDEVPILPDTDFAARPEITDEFRAVEAASGPPSRIRTNTGGPVSLPLLIFWLVIVPASLVALVVFLLLRRNRDAFAFA